MRLHAPLIVVCRAREITEDGIVCQECSHAEGVTVRHRLLPVGDELAPDGEAYCPRLGNRPIIPCVVEERS